MAIPGKPLNDQAAGERLFREVFQLMQKLNATAGPAMAKQGERSGNITFSPKIVIDEDNGRFYTCEIAIYTPESIENGPQIGMEISGISVEQFTQALATISIALTGLAQQRYLSDMFTVGLVDENDEETEIYAPDVLEPGVYSLADEDDDLDDEE
ncbi:MAG TPA: hypothetical protein VKX46_04930 [Ktedonobacteraceae bacterium]|nr:hypothetical protein [Ktedonobacteraceae bacterium]